MDPTQLTIAEASEAIQSGRLSPVALTEAYLDRIAALDGELHSYGLVLHDEALADARARANEASRGPLHGIPIGLKDIYKTSGIRTTAGSPRYLDHVPDEDAETWARLRDAGAVLLGKQETHEFAIGGPDFTLPFAPARNPWNTAHYPAGSAGRQSRWRPDSAPGRWDPTPAARSAGRRPITGSSGSSRPMAGSAGAACFRCPTRSITAVR